MKPKPIKPPEGYTNMTDADVAARAMAVQTGIAGNSNFQDVRGDLTALKTDIDSFATQTPEPLERCARRKEVTMDTYDEILRALGRIEGQLIEIAKLSERVSRLESWQAWMKGGLAALAAASAYLCKIAFGK